LDTELNRRNKKKEINIKTIGVGSVQHRRILFIDAALNKTKQKS